MSGELDVGPVIDARLADVARLVENSPAAAGVAAARS